MGETPCFPRSRAGGSWGGASLLHLLAGRGGAVTPRPGASPGPRVSHKPGAPPAKAGEAPWALQPAAWPRLQARRQAPHPAASPHPRLSSLAPRNPQAQPSDSLPSGHRLLTPGLPRPGQARPGWSPHCTEREAEAHGAKLPKNQIKLACAASRPRPGAAPVYTASRQPPQPRALPAARPLPPPRRGAGRRPGPAPRRGRGARRRRGAELANGDFYCKQNTGRTQGERQECGLGAEQHTTKPGKKKGRRGGRRGEGRGGGGVFFFFFFPFL